MKRQLAFFFIFVSFGSLKAQAFEGYIIDQKKDTVNGYIFPGKKTELFQQVGFSKSKTKNPEHIYLATELLGFQFLGTRFMSANVSVEDPPEKYKEEAFVKPEAKRKEVFLSIEVEGTVNLYSFVDSANRRRLYHFGQGRLGI